MKPDFDWRDCVLIHPSNAAFLRGETMRIFNDSEDQGAALLNALFASFLIVFVAQFFRSNVLIVSFLAFQTGLWIAIFGLLKVARATAKRNEAVVIEGELLVAKSDKAESEGTILTYQFIAPNGELQIAKGFASAKPGRFSAGDRLVVLFAFDGSHTVL